MKLQAAARYWLQDPGSRRWTWRQNAQGAVRPFQVKVVASTQTSTTAGGWKMARIGPAANARPTSVIYFNNRKWTDLTRVFSRGREFWLMTDNRVDGTAKLTLWLAFPSAQSFDLLTYRHPTASLEKLNYARFAKYRTQLMARGALPTACQRQLSADGVPRGAWSSFVGRALYRVEIQAYDRGEYAAYVLTTRSPASRAYGLAKIVSSDRVVSRARVGLFVKTAGAGSTTTTTTSKVSMPVLRNHRPRPPRKYFTKGTTLENLIKSTKAAPKKEFDEDGDGKYELTLIDANRDGYYEGIFFDKNDDGRPDLIAYDLDQNGRIELIEADEPVSSADQKRFQAWLTRSGWGTYRLEPKYERWLKKPVGEYRP